MFDVMVGRVRTLRHSVESCLTLWLGRVRTLRHSVESYLTLWLGGYER